jgi:RNA polymerase sigma factor for flagellar operon FliA
MQNAALWSLYRETGDASARDTLIQESIGLVHHIVKKLRRRGMEHHEHADLVSAGSVGLLEAVETFDPTRGLAFSTFAAQRIRGAILDDLRATDPLRRHGRDKCRRLSAAERAVERREGRTPTAVEVADELGVDLETYWQWKEYAEFDAPSSLEAPVPGEAPVEQRIGTASGVHEAIERDELAGAAREALLTLPERERTILALYYYEELTLKEIAETLGLSEGRVSQLRRAALQKLQVQLTAPHDRAA